MSFVSGMDAPKGQEWTARSRWIVLLATIAAPLLAGCGGEDAAAAPEIPVGTEVGQRAPNLSGQSSAGQPFSLDSLDGGNAVLVFYTSGECGLCRLQLDQLEANLSAYQRIDADVIAVTLDPADRAIALLERTEVPFPIVSVDSATFERWGVMAPERAAVFPGTYVLDDAGVIRFRHIGRNASDRTTDAEIVAVLESIPTS